MPRKSSQGGSSRTSRAKTSATTKSKRTGRTSSPRKATAKRAATSSTRAAAAKKATAKKKTATTKSKKAPVPSLGTGELAEQIRLLAESEQRTRQALEALEKRLQELPGQTAGLLPEGKAAAAGEMDEVTASFRRALSEALDRKLEDLMAPVVSLHHRLQEEAGALAEDPRSCEPEAQEEVLKDAVSKLQKVLRGLGGGFITPEPGEFYDPLIHLAVGEAPAPGGVDGVVAEVLQPGYKSGRGRVVVPARVIVGRR